MPAQATNIELKVTKFGEIVNKEFGYGNGVTNLSCGMNPADFFDEYQ
jgi:hypothetical protein